MNENTLPVVNPAPPPEFTVIPYPVRFTEILELRRLALLAANQIAPHTPANEKFDPRDHQSEVIIAEIEEHIAGSMRITPPVPGPPLHHANRFRKPIVGLPPSSEYLEVSKACVHPAHQGEGLLWQLAAHMVVFAKKHGKPFLVAGVRPNLWPYWQRCGFRETGSLYVKAKAPDLELSLIVLEVEDAIAGSDISPKLARALAPLLEDL